MRFDSIQPEEVEGITLNRDEKTVANIICSPIKWTGSK